MNVERNNKHETFRDSEDVFIDKIASRIADIIGAHPHVKKLRRSEILTALIGAVGFALFINGIDKLSDPLSPLILIFAGFVLMLITGLLLYNLNR